MDLYLRAGPGTSYPLVALRLTAMYRPRPMQACSCILLKLVVDLYLRAGPGTSYPLVLRMLHRALASSPGVGAPAAQQAGRDGGRNGSATAAAAAAAAAARARVFDLLYNLAVHSALLQGGDGAGLGGKAGVAAAAEQASPGRASRRADGFHAWLRALLFPLLCTLHEVRPPLCP